MFRERPERRREEPGADRRRQRRRGDQGRAAARVQRRRADDDDHRGRAGRSTRTPAIAAAPAALPRGQPLRRRAARQPERAGARGAASTIPIQQTSNSVQLDQILTNALQADVRGNLQLLLKELGDGLQKLRWRRGPARVQPDRRPAPTRTRRWSTRRSSAPRPHDLSNLIRNFDRVAVALNRNEPQLKDLVTNLRIVTGSFAAEDEALASSIRQLPGVLDAAAPGLRQPQRAPSRSLRAFAREALPGVRSTGPTLDVATALHPPAARAGLRRELRGLTADLRPTDPAARQADPPPDPLHGAGAGRSPPASPTWSSPGPTTRSATPTTTTPATAIGPVYKETGYGLVGIARREPLRRRQRPVHPRRRRRRHQHRGTSAPAGSGIGNVAGQHDPARWAPSRADRLVAKTPFRPDDPLREPGDARPAARRLDAAADARSRTPTGAAADPARDPLADTAEAGADPRVRGDLARLPTLPRRSDIAANACAATLLDLADVLTRLREFRPKTCPSTARRCAIGRRGRLMGTAIRKHLRDFLAVAGLCRDRSA